MFLNNSDQNASQQRTLLVFMVVIFGGLALWQTFMAPEPGAAPAGVEAAEESAAELPAGEEGNTPVEAAGASSSEAETEQGEFLPLFRIADERSEFFVTNMGARIAGTDVLSPEQYLTREGNREIFPHFTECDDESLDCGTLQRELQNALLPHTLRLPGVGGLNSQALWTYDEELSSCDGQECEVLALRFRSTDDSIELLRIFSMSEEGPYGLRDELRIRNLTEQERRFDDLGLMLYGNWSPKTGGMFNQEEGQIEGLCLSEGNLRSKPARKLDEMQSWTGSIAYAGINERFFLSATLVRNETGGEDFFRRCTMQQAPQDPEGTLELGLFSGEVLLPANGEQRFVFNYFAGPKRFEFLDEYETGLRQSVKFGAFSFLAYPIRAILLFFHGLVPNWGLAILLLTLLIKLLLLPITQKSFSSMEKMKAVQPKIEELKKKYENDQQKLAEAQMKLFREEGVNPLGGCLPLLLQMPVYFALYRVVGGSAELYNAPFFGWIQDLSSRDPLYILPILVSAVMFAQTRLSPSAGASNPQMKIMQWVMPLMFIPIMLFLPSGLVLYIFANMLLSIAQQLYIRRKLARGDSTAKAK